MSRFLLEGLRSRYVCPISRNRRGCDLKRGRKKANDTATKISRRLRLPWCLHLEMSLALVLEVRRSFVRSLAITNVSVAVSFGVTIASRRDRNFLRSRALFSSRFSPSLFPLSCVLYTRYTSLILSPRLPLVFIAPRSRRPCWMYSRQTRLAWTFRV